MKVAEANRIPDILIFIFNAFKCIEARKILSLKLHRENKENQKYGIASIEVVVFCEKFLVI